MSNRWASPAAAAAVAGTLFAMLGWRYYTDPAVPLAALTPSASPPAPVAKAPVAKGGRDKLRVLSPAPGPVGLHADIRLSEQAGPGETLVVLVRAPRAEWYLTPCRPGPDAATSTCPGATFGKRAADGGTWELKAMLLAGPAGPAADVDDLEILQRSATYRYER